MYFNENKENTNIDSEFKNEKGFDFDKIKKPLIIIGSIILFIILLSIIIALVKGRRKYFVTLEGDSTITIYQGVTYNDPGYRGFDNKNNDLTSQVIVKSNLETESVGTYTIIYSLQNSSVTRTINVVERPDIITVIYLMGDKDMAMKVGDTFTDPGYKAVDAIDGDLTDKVTRTGTVDTTKAGIYKIVYSVVNSKGVTTSTTRTISVE